MTIETAKPKALTPLDAFIAELEGMTKQFEMVLPEHLPVDKFKRSIRTAVSMDPKLLDATRNSLYGACMKAAQDGLIIDGREAAIVVYNTNVGTKAQPRYEKTAQFMPMTGGILKKVRNSGELASIGAHVVYEKDTFTFWVDEDGEHLKHEPLFVKDRGQITHAYMIARTKDGGKYVEIMTREELDQVRNCSRAKDSGPWKDWLSEMFKKTVIRRGSKRLPMSSDLEDVIRRDDELFVPDQTPEPEPAEEASTRPSRLGKLIDQQAPSQPPPAPIQSKPATPPPTPQSKPQPQAPDTDAIEPGDDEVPI